MHLCYNILEQYKAYEFWYNFSCFVTKKTATGYSEVPKIREQKMFLIYAHSIYFFKYIIRIKSFNLKWIH